MKIAGIDENGLGPKLGPLVVTGALFESEGDAYRAEAFVNAFGCAGAAGGARVDDSKAVMSASNMAAGETTVLALTALAWGRVPSTVNEFLSRVSESFPGAGLPPCPPSCAGLCDGDDVPLPCFGGTAGGASDLAAALQEGLRREGLRVAALRSERLCPRRLNREASVERRNKADIDLAAFERRILAFAGDGGDDGDLYLCGKVMNLASYSARMTLPARHPVLSLSETRAESRYRLQDLGEVRFVLDGDSLHPPVAAASMVGKYVRELSMVRFNRFFAERVDGHVAVSGYGDPVTRRFVRRVLPLIDSLGVPRDCFLRER